MARRLKVEDSAPWVTSCTIQYNINGFCKQQRVFSFLPSYFVVSGREIASLYVTAECLCLLSKDNVPLKSACFVHFSFINKGWNQAWILSKNAFHLGDDVNLKI